VEINTNSTIYTVQYRILCVSGVAIEASRYGEDIILSPESCRSTVSATKTRAQLS